MRLSSCFLYFLTLATVGYANEMAETLPYESPKISAISQWVAPSHPWGVGMIVIGAPNPYYNTNSVVMALPMVTYQSPKISFYGTAATYTLKRYSWGSSDIVTKLFPCSYNARYGKSSAMQSLNDRYMTVMSGLAQNFYTPVGLINVEGLSDITGVSNGLLAKIQWSIPLASQTPEGIYLVMPSVGIQYQSESLNNYYFGISSSESERSGMPAFSVTDSVGLYEKLTIAYQYQNRWRCGLIFQLNQIPTTIYESPMVDRPKNVLSTNFVFSYLL